MADTITKEARSRNMARIRARDTKPELAVRRYLHGCGLRYRLHARDLPGKPDVVFRSRKVAVFVHGCFWHGCPACIDGRRSVRSNESYWSAKIAGNVERDRRNQDRLQSSGWQVLTIWECETAAADNLSALETAIRARPIARGPARERRRGPLTSASLSAPSSRTTGSKPALRAKPNRRDHLT